MCSRSTPAPASTSPASRSDRGRRGLCVVNEWRPAAPLSALRARAEMLEGLRAFFRERGVLEVETPVLSAAALTDPAIESLSPLYRGPGGPADGRLWLHTSPEFPMKRLLAAGSGPIFQVCRVFRDGEAGRRHNPEFSLLEWYRPGLSMEALMAEVEALVRALLAPYRDPGPARRLSWRQAFLDHAGIDPFAADESMLRRRAAALGVAAPERLSGRDPWLDLLLTAVVEPGLAKEGLVFLYHYPPSQAALARLVRDAEGRRVAERFELYLDGLELANGFHELADAAEQRRRFEAEQARRRASGQEVPPLDERLLAALEAGLPDCCGVALGLDRLLMAALGAECIEQVLAFPIDRA